MNLRKKCPSCGTENPEQEFFCGACGADISAVAPFDPTHTVTEARKQPPTREQKKCPKCGLENEPYAFVCSQPGCGERLDNPAMPGEQVPVTSSPPVPAKPLEGVRAEHHLKKLLLVVGSNTFECKSGDILGRNGTLANQVFSGIPTVSGHHVALELLAERWFLVNLPLQAGRTEKNITVLDGREIPVGESVALTGEHVLKISSRCELKLRLEVARWVIVHEVGHLVIGFILGIKQQGIQFAGNLLQNEGARAWYDTSADPQLLARQSLAGVLSECEISPKFLSPNLLIAYRHSVIITPNHPHFNDLTEADRKSMSGVTDLKNAQDFARRVVGPSESAVREFLMVCEGETRELVRSRAEEINNVVDDIQRWLQTPDARYDPNMFYDIEKAKRLLTQT
jgi:hypothetical protein